MPPPFRKITLEQFDALLKQFPFQRRINAVHMHHTWRPNHAQFQGHDSIVSMWRFHTVDNGWSDIAQHLTIAPDGGLWLGRNWNSPPASAGGHNGTTAAGPFMFEMVGDFDRGRDRFDGPQKEAALQVIARVQDRFNLPPGSLRFHNQMSSKTCPGSAISYEETLRAVERIHANESVARKNVAGSQAPPGAAADDFILFGDDSTPEAAADHILLGDDGEAGGASDATASMSSDLDAAATGEGNIQDLILALLRGDSLVAAGIVGSPYAELPEQEGPAADEAIPMARAEEGLFGGSAITTDLKEALRPHAINLSRGRFSSSGRYQTTADDVDAIFGEDLERAVAGRDATNPLRLVIWAHGGLVDEAAGLEIAHKHVLWWNENGVYPLYFVWETGLLEALGRVITGRSGGEEGMLADRLTEFTDRRVEALARLLQGPGIWSDMKQNARLAVDPNDGGGAYVARKLGEFCARHPGAVELHAVGHSAGAIFHASFLPEALRHQSMPRIKSLALLAPAIRVDRFHERLAPLMGTDRGIERVTLFTMNKLRELDDTCMGIYRKSLLYLIHHALEDRRETPILGLEISLRADPALRTLFGLGGAAGAAAGEVIWSKSPPNAGPRNQSASLTHGGFDDDAPTMDSLLRRILNQDEIRLPYARSETLTRGEAAPVSTPVRAMPDFIPGEEARLGEESVSVEEESYGVPFAVLDAFERVAEMAPDVAGSEATGLERLEVPDSLTIAFGPNARSDAVTPFSQQVLRDIMRRAGISRLVISSTSRNPAEQARVMFNNLERFGVAHQKALYGPAGDQVIEVYRQAKATGHNATTIKARMAQEIIRIGPTRVSRHAADPTVLNVFDVAPSSVARKAAFEQAVRAESRVSKFITPPTDPGYHLEIPQP